MLKDLLNSHIFGYGFKERLIVFALTVIIAGAGFLLGLWLDNIFNSRPILAFAGVLISYPIAQLALAKLLTRRSKLKDSVSSDNTQN
jgi:hypothetical protein